MTIKITPMEKVFAGLLAAALLTTGAFFAGTRHQAAPYRMGVQRPAPAETAAPVPSALPSAPAPAGKLDLNTATAQELEALPGIGEKRAADIVADREQNGPFRHPEDITRVKGIGEGTLAGLIDLITVE